MSAAAAAAAITAGATIYSANKASSTASSAAKQADPFFKYRKQLAGLYSGYLQPGADVAIEQMPGYSQFKTGILDPAMQSAQAKAAASGMLYSGAEQAQLQNIGQQGYYGFMTDYLNRLAQGSGATQNPAQAAGLRMEAANQGLMNTMGASGLASGSLQNLYKGISGSNYNPITSGFYGVHPLTAMEYGTNPFSEQTAMLNAQDFGF